MTAIVGVLNKHAVAIAADSAVTLGGGRKVLNSANKLFALSKYHPVAIAIFGNAELVGTPWEIIIKEFRKSIGNQSFNTLQEYAICFFKFLKGKNYYCNGIEALQQLKESIISFVQKIINISDVNKLEFILQQYETCCKHPYLDGLSDESVEFINVNLDNELKVSINLLKQKGIKSDDNHLRNILKTILTKDVLNPDLTGLVFSGYGELEVYPSIIHYTVGNVINGTLAFKQQPSVIIDKQNRSSICPFAQTDVMCTLLDGIAPKVQSIYIKTLLKTFDTVIDSLSNLIQQKDPELALQVKNLNKDQFMRLFDVLSNQARKKDYTQPFIASVANLEKDDLADFAESLIKLTSLKRKVSPDQETVGGPVDVMVISKGDGVIWMKRKHYFDSNLNHNFFSNYYNL